MKKVLSLIILFTSSLVMSQVCELTVIFSDYIETCDSSTSPSTSCVNVGVGQMHGSNTIALKIYDQSTGVETSIGIPPFPENAIYQLCGYLEGATLEISAFDTSNPDCQSSIFYHTISGCSNIDNDNDTYTADVDCNDRDPDINPGAEEICDRKDNNCDGNIDEGFTQNTYYWDADLDGYGNPNLISVHCEATGRYVLLSGDCDDTDPAINPGATEVCGDGIDNNCDGNIDEEVAEICEDGIDNNCDGNIDEGCGCPDADSDTVCDADDICPGSNDLADSDADGTPDGCDNCPSIANADQADSDGDGIGDACDICPGSDDSVDTDGDGTPDGCDPCPLDVSNDSDGDGVCDSDDICPGSDDSVDTDGDGTPDGCDPCPNDPNDTCGCTAGDIDNDGVCDDIDNCVGISNPDQADADSDSVGDVCDICPGSDDRIDTDLDGTPDGCDACPNDPNKIAAGACGCGVLDIDTDSDGVLDCNDSEINSPCPNNVDVNGVSIDSDRDGTPDCLDLCPNDRNKTQPGTCGCGTSDADKDNDTVPDCIDVCPRGPDTDSDGDGVPDCIDLCPNNPDNSDSDGDGLPDCVDSCPNDATNTCSANTCRAGSFEICHVKKNGDRTTLCVTPSQWARHKTHLGDALGSCTPAAAKVVPDNKTTTEVNKLLNIYPNPLKSNGIWIQFPAKQNTEKFTAIIYDLNGRVLAQKVFETNNKAERHFWEFNSEHWDMGIFILKIEDGTQTYHKRLLKLNH